MQEQTPYSDRSASHPLPIGLRDSLRSAMLFGGDGPQHSSIVAIAASADRFHVSADLTVLTSVSSSALLRLESVLEISVYEQLIRAGWAAEQIVAQYRRDLKSRFIFDFALFDDGNLACLVEVKARELHRSSQKAHTEEVGNTVPWYCKTDGSKFSLFDLRSGTQRELQCAPTPDDLEVEANSTTLPQSFTDSLTYESLTYSLNNRSSVHLLLDVTLPFGQRIQGTDLGDSLFSDIKAHREGGVAMNNLDLQASLLGWCAFCAPSLISVAAIVPNVFLTGERYRWIREGLQSRFGLSAVVDWQRSGYFQMPSLSMVLLGYQTDGALFCEIDLDTSNANLDSVLAELKGWLTKCFSRANSSFRVRGNSQTRGSRRVLFRSLDAYAVAS